MVPRFSARRRPGQRLPAAVAPALATRNRAANARFPDVPITNLRQVTRMAELSGSEVPKQIVDRLERLGDDPKAVRAEGIEIATRLCDRLLEGGAPSLHFYTLNRSTATRQIHNNLGALIA